jgi:hypothetical protein
MIGRILQTKHSNSNMGRPAEIVRRLAFSDESLKFDSDYEMVWQRWYFNRNQPDHLITGCKCSGVLTGLIILQSCLIEGRGPAYFIVPRPHMIASIVYKAQKLGIKAVNAEDDSLKKDFSKIQVTSIRNAMRNVWGTGTVYIDDAGESADEAVSMFSLNIPAYSSLYKEIADLFVNDRTVFSSAPHIVSSVKWKSKSRSIRLLLNEYREFDSLRARIDLLEDMLDDYTCVITGDSVLITPDRIDEKKMGIVASAGHRVLFLPDRGNNNRVTQAFGKVGQQEL